VNVGRSNNDPGLDPDPEWNRALRAIVRVFGHVQGPWVAEPHWCWHWRDVPFGRCIRCLWPANTLAPDGHPWHKFCWYYGDTPPPAFDQWLRRKVEGGEWRGGSQ
jgi:hypothetical protein